MFVFGLGQGFFKRKNLFLCPSRHAYWFRHVLSRRSFALWSCVLEPLFPVLFCLGLPFLFNLSNLRRFLLLKSWNGWQSKSILSVISILFGLSENLRNAGLCYLIFLNIEFTGTLVANVFLVSAVKYLAKDISNSKIKVVQTSLKDRLRVCRDICLTGAMWICISVELYSFVLFGAKLQNTQINLTQNLTE